MRLPQLPLKFPVKLLIAVGALAVAGIGYSAYALQAKNTRAAAVETVVRPARVMEIAYRREGQSLVLAGTVVPRIESQLGFRVAGKIVRRAVDVGAVVQAGQMIAELDPTDYRLAVDNARAAFAAAEGDYMRAKADHERYLQLRNSSAFMQQTLDTRKSAAVTALGRMDQAKSQLESAEHNLAYTELRADADGVITAVQAEAGQVVAQGQSVAKLARTDELEILVGVPEHSLAYLARHVALDGGNARLKGFPFQIIDGDLVARERNHLGNAGSHLASADEPDRLDCRQRVGALARHRFGLGFYCHVHTGFAHVFSVRQAMMPERASIRLQAPAAR